MKTATVWNVEVMNGYGQWVRVESNVSDKDICDVVEVVMSKTYNRIRCSVLCSSTKVFFN